MKINGLQVDNFGVWKDLTIGDLPDDITVFYGPNEAGKSTLMNFVRTILFGFSPEKCQRFLTGPLGQQRHRMGGRLRVQGYEGQFYIRRYADEIDPLGASGDVRVTTVDNSRVGGHKLASLLSGIDEAIYNNVFCLGMGEIQQLSTLNDTQAAQFLYSLSTGTDRVSLVDVMRQIRNARKKLVGNGKPGLLTELIRRRDEQRAQLEQLGRLTEDWGQLQSERTNLDSEIKRLESTRDKLKRQSRMMEIAAGLRPKWVRRQRIQKEITTLGAAPTVPRGIFDRLRSIDDRILQRQHELKGHRDRRELLTRSEKEIGIRDGLQRNAARVKALIEQRSWISTLDEEVRRLESRSDETEFEIHAELEKLGIGAPEDGSDIFPTIDTDTLTSLRGPARILKSAKQKLDHAKREATEHKATAERLTSEMTRQLGGKADWLKAGAQNDVNTMMEKTGALAQNARRRVQLGRDVRELGEQLESIDRNRSRLLQQQFLPRPVIATLACVFGLGSIMVLSSIFGTGALIDERSKGFLFLVGAITCGVGVGVKLLLDGTHRDVLTRTDSQRRRIAAQITDSDEEIARIDATLPPGTSFDQFLDAGDGLDDLDQLLPLDTERRNALDRAALAEKRAIEIATSMKDSRLQWERALSAVGLPARLTPMQVEQLAGRTGNLQFLRRQFHDVQDQLERARRELGTVHNRIVGLMTEAHIVAHTNRPLDQLDQLATTLREQEALVTRRGDIRRQTRELKRQEDRLVASVRRLETKRVSLLTAANATDESDLRRLEDLRLKIESLNLQNGNLAEEITASLTAAEDEALLRRELEHNNEADFKKRLSRTRTDANQVEKQLTELLHRRGELTQQIKATTQDRQLPNAHIRLAIIEQQLRDGLARWKELSATTHLLRRVYKRYEKDRQPETLQHASEYLSRMTNGRYNRIWTPLAEDVLLIDDSAGHSLPIEVLSRGTREQVFLSLRLALISGYARRGVKMPTVLDDVLVNFDIERTVAAAEVLVEFARSGHQVFIFTCHDHIMRVFQDYDAELRDLPRHDNELLSSANPNEAAAYDVTSGVSLNAASSGRLVIPSHESAVPAELVAAGTDSFGASFLGQSMLPTEFASEFAAAIDASSATASLSSNSPRNDVRAVTQELPTAAALPVDTLPTSALSAIASTSVPVAVRKATQIQATPIPDTDFTSRETVRSNEDSNSSKASDASTPLSHLDTPPVPADDYTSPSDPNSSSDPIPSSNPNSPSDPILHTTELTTELPSTGMPIPASRSADPSEVDPSFTEIAQSISEPPIVPTKAVVQDIDELVEEEIEYEYEYDDPQDDEDEIEVEIESVEVVDEVEIEDAPGIGSDEDTDEDDEYEYVDIEDDAEDEDDADSEDEADSDDEADGDDEAEDEYEYFDEDGNPISAEDLDDEDDDEDYEYVEEEDED